MTPHSQDMRGLRFRSTFSGAPCISFRQHRLGGVGPGAGGGGGSRSWASGVSRQWWGRRSWPGLWGQAVTGAAVEGARVIFPLFLL